MASPKTEAMIAEIVAFARQGREVYPMMFQPIGARSNTVSAAIRIAKQRGLLVQDGLDGTGSPKYRAPVPASTHAATTSLN